MDDRAGSVLAPSGWWPAVREIARHELSVAFRTRRVVGAAALYLAAAAVAGLSHVISMRFIERQAIDLLVQNGVDPLVAAGSVSLASEQAFRSFVGLFAGVAPEAIAPSLLRSVVLPPLLWGSLAFLPFLIVLTSFDLVAGDLANRSLAYTVLRVPRAAVPAGKLLAQAALLTILTLLAALTLIGLAGSLLASVRLVDTLEGLVRVVLLLVPYGLCYLAIAAFVSSATRRPTFALFGALGILAALRVAGWLAYVPASASFGFVRYLAYASPARYHDGLWRAGWEAPLGSACVYLAFAAVLVGLAAWRLSERDL